MDTSEEDLFEIAFLTIHKIHSHGILAALPYMSASLHGPPVAFVCFAHVKKGLEPDMTFIERQCMAEK